MSLCLRIQDYRLLMSYCLDFVCHERNVKSGPWILERASNLGANLCDRGPCRCSLFSIRVPQNAQIFLMSEFRFDPKIHSECELFRLKIDFWILAKKRKICYWIKESVLDFPKETTSKQLSVILPAIFFQFTYLISHPTFTFDTSVCMISQSTQCLLEQNVILFPNVGFWKLNWSFAKSKGKKKTNFNKVYCQ